VIDVRDYEAAVKLITALCVKLDKKAYAKLLEA
jgi:putative aminopeptidase FrvX